MGWNPPDPIPWDILYLSVTKFLQVMNYPPTAFNHSRKRNRVNQISID